MATTIHQESQENEGNDNGIEEDPADNMPLLSETKGEDIKELKEEIVAAPEPSEIDKENEPLPLPSPHTVANPYRPSIPLKCHPIKANNKDKPLKMKDPENVKVNIAIGGKEKMQVRLDLRANINIIPYSVYLRLGLGKLKPTSMTLQLVEGSIKHLKGIVEDLLVQMDKFKVPMYFVVLEIKGAQ